MQFERTQVKEWVRNWTQEKNGQLVEDTDSSMSNNYIQVIPHWLNGNDPYQGWVHYEVIKRNEQWFAEFHVELYKCQGREGLELKLNNSLANNKTLLRGILRDSHCANRYWKCRCPIQTEYDLINDLNLLQTLVVMSGILGTNNGVASNDGPVAIKTMQLLEVLALNLQVPNYQRGYCWRMEDVRRMMNDIHVWQEKHKSGNYNIGTIVLKKCKSGDNYDIIDGQQRLTTFALLARLHNSNIQDTTASFTLGSFAPGENNRRKEPIGYLVRARNVLQAFIDNGYALDLLKRVTVNVVCLSAAESDDLSYLFFNHTNSLGRKLTDYELLKGHHLRFVDTASESVDCDVAAQKTVEIWNRLRQPLEVVTPSWNNGNKTILGKGEVEILHKVLFRLRKWGAGESFSPWADDLPTHDLFHHFSRDDEPFDGVTSSKRAIDYDSIVRDGPEFFNYAETYRWKFKTYLQSVPVGLLYANLRGHSNDVLFDIINALGFLFYDKFGEKYLPEALYCITYRVSEIRNKGRVMQKYVGAIEIPGISKWASPSLLSSIINRSNHESILFPILIDPACDYELPTSLASNTRSYWYWMSVKTLIECLAKKMELNEVKNRAEKILRIISEA